MKPAILTFRYTTEGSMVRVTAWTEPEKIKAIEGFLFGDDWRAFRAALVAGASEHADDGNTLTVTLGRDEK